MLPDFPKIKRLAAKQFAQWVEGQVPILSPLLSEVSSVRQHEGKTTKITHPDESKTTLDFPVSEFGFAMTRDEMRRFDLSKLKEKLQHLADELAGAQTRKMFECVNQVASATGNSIKADGELTKENLLEMFRRVDMDFDAKTMAPTAQIVMHPDVAAKMLPRMKAWEEDAAFIAEHNKILDEKKEAWRAREANRKLVD
jgi:hypothetical protein